MSAISRRDRRTGMKDGIEIIVDHQYRAVNAEEALSVESAIE